MCAGGSGVAVRSTATQLLSLPYTVVGSLLLFTLSISGAHLLREVIASIWCYRRTRRKVHDQLQLRIDVENPPPSVSQQKKKPPEVMNRRSGRVLNMEDTLRRVSNSSPTDSPASVSTVGDSIIGSTFLTESAARNVTSSIQVNPSNEADIDIAGSAPSIVDYNNQALLGDEYSHSTKDSQSLQLKEPENIKVYRIPRTGAPWLIFLFGVVVHSIVWIICSIFVFKVNHTLSIQGVFSVLLTLDPGNWLYYLGAPSWVLSWLFCTFLLTSKIIVGAIILSAWPRLSEFLVVSGKELHVTTPVMVRS